MSSFISFSGAKLNASDSTVDLLYGNLLFRSELYTYTVVRRINLPPINVPSAVPSRLVPVLMRMFVTV